MNKYARTSNDAPKYLEWFGGHASKTDRKIADPIFVKRGAVCITGTIQPATFWRCFSAANSENGLLARFLLTFPPVPAGGWSDAVVSPETEADWAHLALALRHLEFQSSTAEFDEPDEPVVIPLTADARDKFASFCKELDAAAKSEVPPALKAAMGKMAGYTAKFALIDHLARRVPPADVVPLEPHPGAEPDPIDEACIDRAIGLTRWFMQETRRIYNSKHGMILGDEQSADTDLLSLIRRKGGKVTARQVAQNFKAEYPTSSVAEAKLDELVEAKLGRWQDSQRWSRGGRPTRYFVLREDLNKPPAK